MRTHSSRPSVVGLIAALVLAACQSTPVSPTQTPSNPKDNFATPGAPTPFLPTMTPVPSPTVRPTATAVPATVTVAAPTLAPTRAATSTPTPVIVNGQPKMWWVDQMVKQADGSFMAPEAVTETIAATILGFYQNVRAPNVGVSPLIARNLVSDYDLIARSYFTGTALSSVLNSGRSQVQIIVGGAIRVIDVRGFSPDGLIGYYTIEVTGGTADVFTVSDLNRVATGVVVKDFYEVWMAHFDLASGSWKIQQRMAGGTK